jgi:Zinc-binding dehydrogenase
LSAPGRDRDASIARVLIERPDIQLCVVVGSTAELIEAGKLTPVIDRTFPLHEAPAAIRYVGERSTQGKTVITV